MRVATVLSTLSALSMAWGCAHSTGTPSTVPDANSVATDTIWYVSARAREDGLVTTRLADSLEYGFVVADYRRSDDVLTENPGIKLRDSTRLSRDSFIAALRARTSGPSPGDSVALMYVHGFGTWQHEALTNTAVAMVRSRSRSPWIAFCWPSKGSGVASPSTRAVLTSGYWNDSTSAAASGPAFSAALSTLLDAVGGAHAVLVAHSMGSQLVSTELSANAPLRARLKTDRLRALAFFAPDLNATQFRDVIVPAMQPLAKRVLLYASRNDRTLAISKQINKSDRAGVFGVASYDAGASLEVIDVTDGQSAGGFFQRKFGSHHALNRASAALFDLMHVVARELPAECRLTLGTATVDARRNWSLTDVSLPSPRAAEVCESNR